MTVPPPNSFVREVLDAYPADVRKRILELRRLIYDVAREAEGIGEICESVKWGEASYRAGRPKSGTPIRLAWHSKTPEQFGLYVHCGTTLIASFKKVHPKLTYDGNRGIIFSRNQKLPEKVIRQFIRHAHTYYLS